MWAPPKGNTGLHEFLVNREGASGKGHKYPDRHPIPGQPRQVTNNTQTLLSLHNNTQILLSLQNKVPKIRSKSQIKNKNKQSNHSARVATILQVTPDEMYVKERRALKDV